MRGKKIGLFALILLITISFIGCEKQSHRTLDNDVASVFPNIEGKNLTEYINQYKIPKDADAYLKDNKVTLENIKEQLAMDKSLVLFDGVLGGKPFIVLESVKLVNEQWLYCEAEDGHIGASLLIKFQIDKDNVYFKVYARDVNEAGVELTTE